MELIPPPSIEDRLQWRRLPQGKPSMRQRWENLLFLHWAVDPEVIADTLPPGLHVDTFHGQAYLGVVPFFMRQVRPRWMMALPGVSDFQELNFRTYVFDEEGVPGVWFYSLDANQNLAVKWARTFYKLPYHYAKMGYSMGRDGEISFFSTRPRGERLHFKYLARKARRLAAPETLEFFLVERYVLFAYEASKKKLYRGRVYHEPYRLSDAKCERWDGQLFALNGFTAPEVEPDHIVASHGVDVEVHPMEGVIAPAR